MFSTCFEYIQRVNKNAKPYLSSLHETASFVYNTQMNAVEDHCGFHLITIGHPVGKLSSLPALVVPQPPFIQSGQMSYISSFTVSCDLLLHKQCKVFK